MPDVEQLMLDYLRAEGQMPSVDQRTCDDRHRAGDTLLDSRFEGLRKDIASSEAKLKIWVLVGLFTLAAFVAGTSATSLIKIGNYQEKIERIEKQQVEYDDLHNRLRSLQTTVDELRWRTQHRGVDPPWAEQPSR